MARTPRIIEQMQLLSPKARYAVGVLAPVATTIVQAALWPHLEQTRFILYFPAVVVSATVAGFVPALLTVVLSTLMVNFFFIPPTFRIYLGTGAEVLQTCLFLVTGVVISYLISLLSAKDRLLAERARSEAALKENEASLRKALGLRDEFLSLASHELKRPLTSLKLQVQLTRRMIKKGEVEGKAAEKLGLSLEQSDRQIDRLARLVDDMLDLKAIYSGRLVTHIERVDLGEVVRDVVERFSIQAEAAGSSIETRVAENVTGHWDRHQIEQLVSNLVSNAVKFGSGNKIELEVRKTEERAVISVIDHGIGIAREDQERIFLQYERAVPANIGGMGLGLFIAKKIVEAHHGRIRVDSEQGHGARFVIELPFGGAEVQPGSDKMQF